MIKLTKGIDAFEDFESFLYSEYTNISNKLDCSECDDICIKCRNRNVKTGCENYVESGPDGQIIGSHSSICRGIISRQYNCLLCKYNNDKMKIFNKMEELKAQGKDKMNSELTRYYNDSNYSKRDYYIFF